MSAKTRMVDLLSRGVTVASAHAQGACEAEASIIAALDAVLRMSEEDALRFMLERGDALEAAISQAERIILRTNGPGGKA